MRIVPEEMTRRWKASAKVGDAAPTVRATIQVQNLKRFQYDTAWMQGGSYEPDRHRVGNFTSMIFGDSSPLFEIRNIKNYTWTRSVEQDVATCTLTLLNTEISPIGNADEDNDVDVGEFDRPGYYTFSRGNETEEPNRWGHYAETGWNGMFVPDRVVKTYEGYGADPSTTPPLDPNLQQSGTWLIDKVTYGADGEITLEMRDFGRLLLDQIVFPPVVPYEEYPLTWSKMQADHVKTRTVTGGRWERRLKRLGRARSSNERYIGRGLTDKPYPEYVSASGAWNGHHANHALENDQRKENKHGDVLEQANFWGSTGQDKRDDTVWWEYVLNSPKPVSAVRLHMRGGAYRVYVSIHDGTRWVGKRKIPYEVGVGGVDINADIPFVKAVIADRGYPFEVVLPKVYRKVKRIRLTFSQLHWFGGEHPWKAGLRDVLFYTGNPDKMGFKRGNRLKVVGNYNDYTQIVKWVCAWGGFYWPPDSSEMNFFKVGGSSNGRLNGADVEDGRVWQRYDRPMTILPDGRVWGDWMRTGVAGQADLTIDLFDKKPLMDVINYVRDVTKFSFWVDETGGIVWRMPNLWSLGNYVSPHHLQPRELHAQVRHRSQDIVTLDENTTLLGYRTLLDSTNVRERIFVADVVGGVGTVIKGFNPYPVGLRRVAGWTDQNFKNKRETRVMADMISAQQMFTYRRGQASIPGYPAIQIDDQVRIFERVTNETYYHYVMGITCNLDMESGEYIYDLDTHWLGERPEDAWVVKVEELPAVTRNYLNAIGYRDHKD